MIHHLRFGKTSVLLDISGLENATVIAPKIPPGCLEPIQEVVRALQNPYGFDSGIIKKSKSVAIGINDKTRPVPHGLLLPPLLKYLEHSGMKRDQVQLIIASGTHQPMRREEYDLILPAEIIRDYSISSHDCDHCPMVILGQTSRGTPVLINQNYYEADLKITVGNIEPHHFMGYTGGAKAAAIGLSGRKTITRNHAFITHPNAITGRFDDNPMRQDVEEIGKMIGVQMVLNAILNAENEIVHVIAGDPSAVMNVGRQLSRTINEVNVDALFDLVIVSPGGYPKDINFYQSQKALTHAGLITRDGGDILLIAECIDGIGNAGYVKAMQSVHSHAEAVKYFNDHEFEVGPHKAFLIARDGVRKNIHLHSLLTPEQVNLLQLNFVPNPQEFLVNYFSKQNQDVNVAILPFGTTTIPHLINKR